MELLEGQTLKQRIGGHPMETDALLDLGIQIADALESAHAKGIISSRHQARQYFCDHTGTKPKYSILAWPKLAIKSQSRDCHRCYPGDGDSRWEFPHESGVHRGHGGLYVSPSRRGAKTLDTRTDLFSFGAVLYEMATGALPFRGDTSAVIFEAILNRGAGYAGAAKSGCAAASRGNHQQVAGKKTVICAIRVRRKSVLT